MAMIDGQTPTPQELPGDYKRRVVVKFRPDVRLPYTTDAQTQFANTAPREWTELTAAHPGIDVRWAWGQADGSGVGFVDMERGWTLNHEDLVAAGINIISGVNTDYTGHGTAVLGEVVMVDNTIGGVGIAPFASARVVSQWRNGSTYNTAEAILSAAAVMKNGDVLLLEAQTTSSTMSGYLPVAVEQATFDAIEYATSNGIIRSEEHTSELQSHSD